MAVNFNRLDTLMTRQLLALLLVLCVGSARAQLLMNVGPRSAAGGFVGPIDVIASPVACWSLRACSNAATGTKIATICNSGDANCADINSLSNGNFDVATAQGAPLNCGGAGGTCTIKLLYDQTGTAANNVGQVTIARRPTLVFNCIGVHPCAAYNGTQGLGIGTFTSSSSQPYSMSAVVERTGTFTTQGAFAASNGTGVQFLFGNTTNAVAIFGGSLVPTVTASDSAWHALQGMWNTTTSKLNVDGTNNAVSLGSTGNNALTGSFCVGSDSGTVCTAANPLTGNIAEILVWTGDQSANFTALCHNQFVYWGTSTSC